MAHILKNRGLVSLPELRRRDFLLSAAAVMGAPRSAFSQSVSTGGKPLIVIFAQGGWDVTYCLDPKLGVGVTIDGPELDPGTVGEETVGTFGNLQIELNEVTRPNVTTFFDQWYAYCHVINGLWTGSIAHDPCRYRMLSGQPDGRHADLASIVGYELGGNLPLGAVDLSGWSIAGTLAASTGRVGDQNQIVALIDDALATNQEFSAPSSFSPAFTYPLSNLSTGDLPAIEDFVRSRTERLRSRFGGDGGHNDRLLDDLISSLDRGRRFREDAGDILASGDSALVLGKKSQFLDQIDIGVELIQKQICYSVTIDTRSAWDTHEGNLAQHGYYNDLFFGLSHLMSSLQANNMLDQVVVAVISEMTRTPKLNGAGGKDHWAHTSAMLMGAVRGNVTSGGTTELLESRPVDLETGVLVEEIDGGVLNKYDNLAAGILELAGVSNGADYLPNVAPFRGAHPV